MGLARHRSQPELRPPSLAEFMRRWNSSSGSSRRGAVQNATDHLRTAALLWPLSRSKHNFVRDTSAANSTLILFGMETHRCQNRPGAALRELILMRASCQSGSPRDGDLLPSAWFPSPEALARLQFKLQRKSSLRRSLCRANNRPFGEELGPRRLRVLEKYQHFPRCGAIRRVLSEERIQWMDPGRDIEPLIRQCMRRDLSPFNRHSNKRVSFSADDGQPRVEVSREEGQQGQPPEKEPPWSVCSGGKPTKPILARKSSTQSQQVAVAAMPLPPQQQKGQSFRQRTGTAGDPTNCCAMDYPQFRAWRRGSRLSVDVLNNASAIGEDSGRERRRRARGRRSPLASKGGGGWVQLLKRMLGDWLRLGRDELVSLRPRF